MGYLQAMMRDPTKMIAVSTTGRAVPSFSKNEIRVYSSAGELLPGSFTVSPTHPYSVPAHKN